MSFSGPLFLVGMPRSGTTLLRGLLVEHSRLGIATIETNFLTYWTRRWESFSDLSDPKNFLCFYKHMLPFSYFQYMKNRGELIRCEAWYEGCRDFTLQGVFEALIRHDSGATREGDIWGDKSPSYLIHMSLLKRLFPEARFIHIIRDVRDYCLSIHRAWNKNMLRAAQRWNDNLRSARRTGHQLGNDYIEVLYEELLNEPERELRRLCGFLGLEFEEGMLQLSRAYETIGDARETRRIKADNKEKYRKLLNRPTRLAIESLTADVLRELGFPVDYFGPSNRLSKAKMLYYQALDGYNLLRFSIRDKDFLQATLENLRSFRAAR